jgi:hypothetical protein
MEVALSNKCKIIEFISKADKNIGEIRVLLRDIDTFIRRSVKSAVCSKEFSDVVTDYFKLSSYLQSANLDEKEFLERSFQALYRAVIITDEIRKSLSDRLEKLNKLFDESSILYKELEEKAVGIKRKLNEKKVNKTAEVTELLDVLDEKQDEVKV